MRTPGELSPAWDSRCPFTERRYALKGTIRQRAKGSWTLWFDVGKDENGKRRQKTITIRGTKRDAERELHRLIHALEQGDSVQPSKETVAAYLSRWLADYAKPNTAPRTYDRYEEIVRAHLIPALGGHALAKLQPTTIQAYYAQALRAGKRVNGGGLSPTTVRHHHAVLRKALGCAVKWGILARNPCEAVTPPRPARPEFTALDAPAAVRLLQTVHGTSLHLLCLLALGTGMRLGEILGLRWRDVDLDGGTIVVRQVLQQVRTDLRFKTPKTAKSKRRFKLPALLVRELRQHREVQAQERALFGREVTGEDLVVANTDGTPRFPGSVSQGFRRVSQRHGFGVRFHDLRHSHISLLIWLGVHAKTISTRAGHANIGTTVDIYGHLIGGLDNEAAARLDEALRTAMGGDG